MSAGAGRTAHLSARALLCALAGLAVLLTFFTPYAGASPTTPPASLSNVRLTDDGDLAGVVTLRAGTEDVHLDPGSLRVAVGGEVLTPDVSEGKSRTRSVMIVVDTSGSMAPEDMAAVRGAVAAFLAEAPEDVKVGLVTFSDEAHLLLKPGADRAIVQQAVDTLVAGGETALYDAVRLAARSLGTSGDRSLLLLSDGGDTVSDTSRAAAAKALKSAGVRAEIIAFKTQETDTSALTEFAEAGSGSVAQAGDAAGVTAAFRAAAKALDSQVPFSVHPEEGLSGPQEVVVTGTAGGAEFATSAIVDFGSPATPTTGATPDGQGTAAVAPPAPYDEDMPFVWWLPVALVAVFLGILGIVATVLSPMLASDRRRRVESIERYMMGGSVRVRDNRQGATPSALGQNLVGMGDRVMEGRSSTMRTQRLMERADLPWRPGEWLVLRVVAALVGMAIGLLLLGGWFGGLAGIVIGVAAPGMWLRFMAARRAKRFERQLPDVLMLSASSLQSGFSLHQALDSVAKDGAQPCAKEISRALAEARIGTDIADALERVGERMESTNMVWTAMAVRIQREVGGNLAETLRTTAQTLRERETLLGQVRALSAEGRLSAYILLALPVFIFFYLYVVNFDYLSKLWTTGMGIAMLAGSAVLLVVGIFWMRKVVTVEV